ncbi:MAG TPA: sugar kinase [Actinocrinis sp.]|nr:sugar kinase [Actinocrinis sp.]
MTCVGEALAVLIPDEDGAGYALVVGGAEANVACTLAALGVPARWVGRVGDDHFGRVVLRTLAGHGVDVSAVEVDPRRQTGLYVKEIVTSQADAAGNPSATRMRYYRAGSAACDMSPALADTAAIRDTPLLHLSGITAALSESCAALTDALVAPRRPGRIVAFDVNLRPALWAGRDPAVLIDLARRADLVFVGADEAEAICGVGDPDELRRLMPEPRTLVVKQGADGAVGFEAGERVEVPALPVRIAEPTGAGDAFAAGFIAGTLRDLPLRDRLRLGTLAASCALRVRGDLGTMPGRAAVERFIETGELPEAEAEIVAKPGATAESAADCGNTAAMA